MTPFCTWTGGGHLWRSVRPRNVWSICRTPRLHAFGANCSPARPLWTVWRLPQRWPRAAGACAVPRILIEFRDVRPEKGRYAGPPAPAKTHGSGEFLSDRRESKERRRGHPAAGPRRPPDVPPSPVITADRARPTNPPGGTRSGETLAPGPCRHRAVAGARRSALPTPDHEGRSLRGIISAGRPPGPPDPPAGAKAARRGRGRPRGAWAAGLVGCGRICRQRPSSAENDSPAPAASSASAPASRGALPLEGVSPLDFRLRDCFKDFDPDAQRPPSWTAPPATRRSWSPSKNTGRRLLPRPGPAQAEGTRCLQGGSADGKGRRLRPELQAGLPEPAQLGRWATGGSTATPRRTPETSSRSPCCPRLARRRLLLAPDREPGAGGRAAVGPLPCPPARPW